MPVLTLDIASKKFNKEEKAKLISDLTDVMHENTGIRKEAFIIIIHENNTDNIGSGGIQLTEKMKDR